MLSGLNLTENISLCSIKVAQGWCHSKASRLLLTGPYRMSSLPDRFGFVALAGLVLEIVNWTMVWLRLLWVFI